MHYISLREQVKKRCWELYAEYGPCADAAVRPETLADELGEDPRMVEAALRALERTGVLRLEGLFHRAVYQLVRRPARQAPACLRGRYLDTLNAVVSHLQRSYQDGWRDRPMDPAGVAMQLGLDARQVELAFTDLFREGFIEKSRTGPTVYRLAHRPPESVMSW